MLLSIHIQNYAIIDVLQINFTQGLNIITGETGAGKSILMGALGLVLGDRADSNVLLDKQKKCVVEASFKNDHYSVNEFLKKNDLDIADDLVIRREIAVNGKSRAFINDTPVNLNDLRELTGLLVDLHQQFDTLELGENDFQRQVIDALAGQQDKVLQYHQLFKELNVKQRELDELEKQRAEFNKELDYNSFLYSEFQEAGLKENELEETEEKLKVINNAENIKSTLDKVYTALQENDQPLIQQLKSLSNQLSSLKSFHSSIDPLIVRMHAAQVELQDIADEIDRINNAVGHDAKEADLLNERLSAGYKLLKKHNVQTTAQLLEIQKELEKKLEQFSNIDDSINKKKDEVIKINADAVKLAEAISAARSKQADPFAQKVNKLLAIVGMPNAGLKVSIEKSSKLTSHGLDNIEFLFDANKTRFEPLRKVASGGELSRLMLSIKSLVAESVQLPTLIFDEIDTGISGEAARQVGMIMKKMCDAHQVIAITHQPQIAAKATSHYFIYKEIKGNSIVTSAKLLNEDERITAIATMLSGEKPTAAAFANAKEMIGN